MLSTGLLPMACCAWYFYSTETTSPGKAMPRELALSQQENAPQANLVKVASQLRFPLHK